MVSNQTKSILTLILIAFSFCNFVTSENKGSSELNDLADKIKTNLSASIPGIDQFGNEMPNVEDVQNILKKKCEQNGPPGTFDRVEAANEEIKNCFNNLINITVVQNEIESAKQTGSLDVVFGKYCAKVPEFESCVKNYTDILELCLDSKEKDSKKVVLNVTKSLSEFVCHKSGDRIAMFIAERGPECLAERQNEIQECANKTVGKHVPAEMPSLDNIPMFLFQESECNDIQELQDCIVHSLQSCEDPTPSNIIESLFKFIVKMTPCGKILNQQSSLTKDAAAIHHIPIIFVIFISLVTIVSSKFI